MKKIVILGPESTGKSSLCESLAAHYETTCCKEYARAYLLQHGTNYSFDDLLTIAKGQIQLEDEVMTEAQHTKPGTPVFFDTDMRVMQVWSEFVFGKCHHFILQQIAKRPVDLYLLCNTDLPWVKDELREYPDLKIRDQLFYHYKEIVINSGFPWALVSGTDQQRIQNAIDAVDKICVG